jgi:hypothetical protein
MKLIAIAIFSIFPIIAVGAPVFFHCEGFDDKASQKSESEIALDEAANTFTYQQISGSPYLPGTIVKVSPTLTPSELIGVIRKESRPIPLIYKISIDRSNLSFMFYSEMGGVVSEPVVQRFKGRCSILKKQNIF